jgi:hypothetical protein
MGYNHLATIINEVVNILMGWVGGHVVEASPQQIGYYFIIGQ